MVGTYKALPILSGAISQMRRGTGQGDLVWDRMQFDEQWKLLMESLWDYQYTKDICTLDNSLHLSEVLYEETQGITDLAIKLFMFAQERAITSGEEEISASIIRSAAKDKFNLLQPALKAFKNKDKAALADFEDAYPEFLKVILLEKTSEQQIEGEIKEEPEFINLLPSKDLNQTTSKAKRNFTVTETQQAITEFFHVEIPRSNNKRKSKNNKISGGLLPVILDSIEKPDKESVYSSLSKAGFIKSGSEFMSEENPL